MYAIVRLDYVNDSYDWDFHQHLTFASLQLAQNYCDNLNGIVIFPIYKVVKIRFEDL